MPNLLESLPVLSFGREYLLKALAACGDAKLDYRPPTSADLPPYSLREQFLHIADIGEMFVCEGVLGQAMPEAGYRLQRNVDGSWQLREAWFSADSVRAELQQSWDFQDQHVFGRPLEDLGAHVGREGRSLLADEIGWLILHESQHRGQILLLLRLAGLNPPQW